MFNWVCPRCGHEVPPSKTECPFCAPAAPEPAAGPNQTGTPQTPPPIQQYPPQQYPASPYNQQYPPPGAPQYAPQAPPPYWQPPQYQQGQAPQYQPGQPPPYQQGPPQYYPQQGAPQYWQPQPPWPPQEPPLPPQNQALPPQPTLVPQYQPPPPEPPQYAAPAPPPYVPPPPVADYRSPEQAATPWLPPETKTSKPLWLIGALTCIGVLAFLGLAYFLMGSHGSSSAAKDTAVKQQTTNPMQKYIEVVGVRILSGKNSEEEAKFLVVNHSDLELTDLTANVTLWASTQRSEEDSVGSFTFHADSIGPNDSKELTSPLKTDKQPSEMPDDWRNMTADVQITSAPQ